MDDDAPVDEAALQIRQQMDETRAALTDKLEVLEQQVTGTVETVKDSVTTVRNAFDLKRQVEKRPWAFVAGAAALGFAIGHRRTHRLRPPAGNGSTASQPPRHRRPSLTDTLGDTFHEEIAALKGLAIGAVLGIARDMVTRSVPPPMEPHVGEVINGITTKLGGRPIHGELWTRQHPAEPAPPPSDPSA